MELDFNEVTERFESSLTKPPSPTTEKLPFTPGNRGNHGNGFPGNRGEAVRAGGGDNYNDQREVDGESNHHETMTVRQNHSAQLSHQDLGKPGKMENHDDSDSDMPPLEYEDERAAKEEKLKKLVKEREKERNEKNENENSEENEEEEVDSDGWLDILGNGLMKKKVLAPGSGLDSRPIRSERVVLDVRGRLEDGTEVENHTDLHATLGEGDLNTAVDMCVALMEKGETCELTTDPKYAYGAQGLPPSIPGDASLRYTLTLRDVRPPLDMESLSMTERARLATEKRERGNFYFTRGEHPQALSCYNKAIEILRRPERLDSTEHVASDELKQLLDVEAKCYNNLAAAQIKMEAYDAAIISSDGVIRLQPDNVKALFRKGKALAGKGDLDAAIAILRKALKIEPESKLLHAELSRLVKEQHSQADKERDMYRRMLGQDKTPDQASQGNSMLVILGVLATVLALIMGLLVYNNRRDLQ